MSAKITLTITDGNLKGEKFIFEERSTCIIGRAIDCNPKLPDDENHRTISRYHCLLDINPPNIRVRDFGSKNGTFVNGKKIGQRQSHQTPEEAAKINFPEYDLKEGDEIKLSHTIFRVNIEEVASVGEITQIVALGQIKPAIQAGDPNMLAISGYTTLKLLGRGGCGEVYLVRHNQTGELLALKVMRPEIAANQHNVNRFLREIENTKILNHPNVVRLNESGYFEGNFFFTLEYCYSGSVINIMERRGGKLSIDEAVAIILQVLEGLEYAHNADIPHVKQRGLVHRDLKPANIFMSDRTAKIGDYGLAKAFDLAGLSGQTMTGTKAGTPAFISRQQVIDFKYAKPEVDVWAAAATLYFMLTGAIPRNFIGADPFFAVLQTNAIPIRDRLPSIPKPLAKAIDLALIDNPEIYFKTAAEFKQALLKAYNI